MMLVNRGILLCSVPISLSLPLAGAQFEKIKGHDKTWLGLDHLGTSQ